MRIPLYNRLKRRAHREIAALQDSIVEIVYSLEGNAVLHGGTAIWRCFQGNRFSEDLDFYFPLRKGFKESFERDAAVAGLEVLKFKQTSTTVFSKISSGNAIVSLEVALREFKKPVVKEYEKIDGSFIDVFVPSAEELLLEKLEAFKSRRLIRDVFDAYHLSNFVERNAAFEKKVCGLLETMPKPVDEKNLKSVVLFGAVPGFGQMAQALKRRFSK